MVGVAGASAGPTGASAGLAGAAGASAELAGASTGVDREQADVAETTSTATKLNTRRESHITDLPLLLPAYDDPLVIVSLR